ncbi:MAG: helix-turn-helix domain-containing protein [Thermomicrobiales bacterium]|nr:helix-turn-helix domain-containing protein [Thermomicrobiales bacterium]
MAIARKTNRKRPLIGAQVRKLRTAQGLTLAQVSATCGLNIGYLSQIETDKASPSLETLFALSEALDVPLHWFLTSAAPPPRVVRKADREIEWTAYGKAIEIVDGGFARTVRIVEGIIPPGVFSPDLIDSGEEHHIILEGELRVRQGDFETTLYAGDYLVWDGTFPHEAENTGPGPCRLLVITPGPASRSIG